MAGVKRSREDSLHVLFIHWDAEHTSPPIGLYHSYAEVEREITRVRKLLKRAGYKVKPRMVTSQLVVNIATMESWLTERIEHQRELDPESQL